MKKVKISELPLYTSLDGLYLIATDSVNNKSVKVPIEDIIGGTGGSPDPGAEVTYEQPVITSFSYDDIPVAGGTVYPSVKFRQSWSDNAGNSGTLTQETTGYSAEYKRVGVAQGFTVDESTGAVSTTTANEDTSRKNAAHIQVKITANGQTSAASDLDVCQEANVITYKTPSVVGVGYDDIPAEGGTVYPIMDFTQDWSDSLGNSGRLTKSTTEYSTTYTPSSGAADGVTVDSATGAVTAGKTSATDRKSVVTVLCQVTANGLTSSNTSSAAVVTVYQAAAEDVTYEYSTPEVTLTYATMPNGGGELSPTYSYTQVRTGNDGSSTIITSGGSLSWSISNRASDVSFDTSSGDIMCLANGSDSSRTLGTVQLTVTMNGKTGVTTAAVTQAARTYSDEYAWSNLRLTYPTAENTAGSVSPSGLTYTLTRTRTYSDGTVETNTWSSGASVTYSISATGSGISINSSTGAVSFTVNTSDSQKNLGTVTATLTLQGQTATVTQTVYQAARTYEYSDPQVTLVYDDIPANGGTAMPTCTYTQTRTGSDGSTKEITDGGSLSYTFGAVYDDDMTYDSSTGAVTVNSANNNPSRTHVCIMKVTVTLNGKTGTAECTVYQAAAEDEPLTVPTVKINTSTLHQEPSGPTTTAIYFGIDVTTDSRGAWIVSPLYFLGDDGIQYEVTEERRYVTSATYTDYRVDLPALGLSSTTINSATLYAYYYGEYREQYIEGEVASTNQLVDRAGTWGF